MQDNIARMRAKKQDEGFTLIELLVVIIIIGILAAIAIPVFLNQRKKGVDASLKSDLRTVAEAEVRRHGDREQDADDDDDDQELDQGEALLALGVEALAKRCKHWGVSFRRDGL